MRKHSTFNIQHPTPNAGDLRSVECWLFRPALAAILFPLLLLFAVWARAETAQVPSAKPQTASEVSPPALDRAISQTIHERKYLWRMPREKIKDTDADKGIITRFFDNVGAMLRRWARAVAHWLAGWLQTLFRHRHPVSVGHSSGYSWIMAVQLLLWSLVAVVLSVLAIFLYRLWRDRRKPPAAVAGEVILPVPDLADEKIGADQLPEDGWTKLARELLERGEFRLALRAFYLASLSHLAERNLIRIARFKSNRDYERELRRRGHSFPELLAVFGDNISVFERIWYGMHEVNRELVNQFSLNVDRLKAAG
jgi:Domain of unknown function (DUF4129)